MLRLKYPIKLIYVFYKQHIVNILRNDFTFMPTEYLESLQRKPSYATVFRVTSKVNYVLK